MADAPKAKLNSPFEEQLADLKLGYCRLDLPACQLIHGTFDASQRKAVEYEFPQILDAMHYDAGADSHPSRSISQRDLSAKAWTQEKEAAGGLVGAP